MTRELEQTKSTIDRIGEKLKAGEFDPEVLRGLDFFRSSHDRIIPMVLHAVSNRGILTLRAAKSTASIVAKLRRESVRLSQIQDIAGCRLIVQDTMMQAEFVEDSAGKLYDAAAEFMDPDAPPGYRFAPSMDIRLARLDGSIVDPKPSLRTPNFVPNGLTIKNVDRLANPQFGYRAVHVVVGYRSRYMEIQVRTQLQHEWAELSEKTADKYGHDLKYGLGNVDVLEKLVRLSRTINSFEDFELEHYYDDEFVDDLDRMRKQILDVVRSEAFTL